MATRTHITATLSVQDWPGAMDFYRRAFEAQTVFEIPGGGVAQLSVDGADFWVAEESKPNSNFSPQTLGGCSVRMILITENPDAVVAQAVKAGAKLIAAVRDDYGWRLGRIEDPAGHHWEIGKPLIAD